MRPRCVCSAAGTRRNLRNDLLVAADSITNTMSSLVKELHSGRSYLAAEKGELEGTSWRFAFRFIVCKTSLKRNARLCVHWFSAKMKNHFYS